MRTEAAHSPRPLRPRWSNTSTITQSRWVSFTGPSRAGRRSGMRTKCSTTRRTSMRWFHMASTRSPSTMPMRRGSSSTSAMEVGGSMVGTAAARKA